MTKFGLKPIKRKIEKYEERLKTSSLNIKQQKEILQELKARPYRFVYDQALETPIDLVIQYGVKNAKYRKILILEMDSGETYTFKVEKVKVTI